MKRFNALFLGAVMLAALTGCNGTDSVISSDSEGNSIEVSTVEDNDISVSRDEPSHDDTEESSLDSAIREAIFTENYGNYLPGEFQGVGYKIIETFEDDSVLSVYDLSEYVEYGFQDGVFVNVSGTNPRVLMRFRQMNSINRAANVGERESHEGKLLTDLVSNEDFIMETIKEYPLYPEWTGTQERIENNIRYSIRQSMTRNFSKSSFLKCNLIQAK